MPWERGNSRNFGALLDAGSELKHTGDPRVTVSPSQSGGLWGPGDLLSFGSHLSHSGSQTPSCVIFLCRCKNRPDL